MYFQKNTILVEQYSFFTLCVIIIQERVLEQRIHTLTKTEDKLSELGVSYKFNCS